MNSPLTQWVPVGLAIASALGQIAILAFITKRKLRSDFRLFFTYNASAVVIVVVSILSYLRFCRCGGTDTGGDTFFYIYWTLSTLLMLLEFGVMYEVFTNIVKPYTALIDLGRLLFRWAGAFLLIASMFVAVATVGPQSTKLFAAVTLMERSLRLIQCGFLLLFFLFERRLGLSWRSPSVSIALGLGTSAAVGLIVSYLRDHFWAGVSSGLLDNASYLAIVIFWVVCFALPQPAPARKSVLDSPARLIFQRWNEALQATPLVHDKSPAMATVESFLPGIEKTVDRVMARKAVS